LARDLYIPKWHPDGEVVAHSSHFLNPWINASGSNGWDAVSEGFIFDFKCRSKALVCSSMGSWSNVAVPAKICWAYSLVHSSLISDHSGSWVKMVPCA